MEALYSKYRPKVFSDVVGQKHILQTLQNAIEADKISHAYLFCGPRGTGKTTLARLLAKACLCQSAKDSKNPSIHFCGSCQDCDDIASGIHPDVYELDAASRTGVENVREEIINRVGFSATRGNKKVYIIDEVHMLSIAAFNALLKTLEEPPNHVLFILCTTDPQKVPDTIISRCQRFNFNVISAEDILDRLKYVCNNEGVNAEDDALQIIANNAQGAMRNALTQLEQIIAYTNGDITKSNVDFTLGGEYQIDYSVLIESLGMRDLPAVFDWVSQLCETGIDFNKVCENLIHIFRDMYVKSVGGSDVSSLDEDILSHLNLYTSDRLHRILIILSDLEKQMKNSNNLRLSFEISMAKIANPKSDLNLESLAERIANLELVATAGDLSPAFSIAGSDPGTDRGTDSGTDLGSDPVTKVVHFKEDMSKEEIKSKIDLSTTITATTTDSFSGEDNNIEENLNNEDINLQSDQTDVMPKRAANNISDSFEKDEKSQENIPEFNIPNRPDPIDFAETRKEIKEEALGSSAVKVKEGTELHKQWHRAFSQIKNKYPAFGATLLTATPSFDSYTNQFILSFPGSASFSVGVLKKPESMQKIHDEIKSVMGEDIGFNIVIDDTKDDNFNPQFLNNFRNNPANNNGLNENLTVESESLNNGVNNDVNNNESFSEKNLNESLVNENSNVPLANKNVNKPLENENFSNEEVSPSDKLKDILNSYGAFNITEE